MENTRKIVSEVQAEMIGEAEVREILGRWSRPRNTERALYDAMRRGQAPQYTRLGEGGKMEWCRENVMIWCRNRASDGMRPWVGVEHVELRAALATVACDLETILTDREMPAENEQAAERSLRLITKAIREICPSPYSAPAEPSQ